MLASCLVWGMIGCAAASAWAQDAAADPAAANATEGADAAPPAAADGANPKPAVESPLVVEPKTPEAIFEAIVLMVELARLDVARVYLQKFMETDPPDDLLLALREKHGPGIFLKFTNLLLK